MFAENSCYRRENMLVLNMVEQGLFGEIICAEGGYIHDCTHLMYFPIGDYGQDRAGEPTWRGRILQQYNGSWYPTHSLGPVAQWLGINRHDRLVTTTTYMSHGPVMPEYVRQRFGAEHPDARPASLCGRLPGHDAHQVRQRRAHHDHRGHDQPPPAQHGALRPARHRRLLPVAAVHGRRRRAVAARQSEPSPTGRSPAAEFDHPLWQEHEARAARTGHGGGDYFVLSEFIECIRNDTPPPIDVVDGVTWSSIFPLSMESVRQGGAPIPVPDFRQQGSPVGPTGEILPRSREARAARHTGRCRPGTTLVVALGIHRVYHQLFDHLWQESSLWLQIQEVRNDITPERSSRWCFEEAPIDVVDGVTWRDSIFPLSSGKLPSAAAHPSRHYQY